MTIKGPLTYLLGYEKLKLIKFFLNNQGEWFPIAELSERTKISTTELRKELKQALKYGVVDEEKQDKILHYKIRDIAEIKVLEDVIFNLGDTFFDSLEEKIQTVGEVHLCVLQGVFLQRDHDRVDLFMVVDDLDEKKFERLVAAVESELGTELRYSVIDLKDFEYRKNMFDKFVWGILEDTRTKILVDKSSVIDDNI